MAVFFLVSQNSHLRKNIGTDWILLRGVYFIANVKPKSGF